MIGEEDDRLAVGRQLDAAADQALAGQLGVAVRHIALQERAVESQADAVGAIGDLPGRGSEGVGVGEPVAARPGVGGELDEVGARAGDGDLGEAGEVDRWDADGQVVKTWTDRHTDVPCNVMPLNGREIRGPNQTYVVANTSIALQGHYADIVESDRAIVGSTTYDILLVEHTLDTMTVLSCEVVR